MRKTKEKLSSVVIGELDGIIRHLIDTTDDSDELLQYVVDKINKHIFSREKNLLKKKWKNCRFFTNVYSFGDNTLFIRFEKGELYGWCHSIEGKDTTQFPLNACLAHVKNGAWKEITLDKALKMRENEQINKQINNEGL